MVPYLIALLLLFIGGFISKNKTLGILSILFMLVLSLFRGENVGSDTIEYINPSFMSSFSSEGGMKSYEIVNAVVASLQPLLGNYVLVWFYSLVTFCFIFFASKRFKVNVIYVFFFLLIFKYFNLSLNIARQFAAASVLLYAYSFLIEENKKKYWFFPLLLFAIGIHISSIVFVIVYFLRKLNLTKANPVILAITFIFVYFFIQTLAQPFVRWANMYALSLDDNLSYYGGYLDMTEEESRNILGTVFTMFTISFNIFILLRIIRIKKDNSRLVSCLLFIGIIVSMFLSNIYGAVGRMQYNISIFFIIAYAYFFMYDKSKYKLALLVASVVLYGTLYIWDLSHMGGVYGTVPYSFMF